MKAQAGTARRLNPRQLKFVLAFVETGNATEAAKRAGYSGKTAALQGHALLRNPKVAAEIEKRQAREIAKFERRAEVSYASLLDQLAQSAYANIADFCDALQSPDPLGAIRALGPKARAVAGITIAPRPKGPPKFAIRLRDADAAAGRLLDELRKGPPRHDTDQLPPIDMSELDEVEVADVRRVSEMLQQKREAKAKRLELKRDPGEDEPDENC
jgi:hypothetical protein